MWACSHFCRRKHTCKTCSGGGATGVGTSPPSAQQAAPSTQPVGPPALSVPVGALSRPG